MSIDQNLKTCPNCGEKLKTGWTTTNVLIPKEETSFINEILGRVSEGYCSICSIASIKESVLKYREEKNSLNDFLIKNISAIPILTTHNPFGWEYESISIVTGQSVTGTGLFSEIASGFTDFFGAQSGSFNSKLADGEVLCFAQLRLKALNLNANAIIGTDIDYGDVGGSKGMLMVCAAGTAVKLKNTSVLGDGLKIIEELTTKNKHLKILNSYKAPYYGGI